MAYYNKNKIETFASTKRQKLADGMLEQLTVYKAIKIALEEHYIGNEFGTDYNFDDFFEAHFTDRVIKDENYRGILEYRYSPIMTQKIGRAHV